MPESFPKLLSLPAVLLSMIVRKISQTAFFMFPQTCRSIAQFLHSDRGIVHLDEKLFITGTANDLKLTTGSRKLVTFEAFANGRVHTLVLPMEQSPADAQRIITSLNNNNIECSLFLLPSAMPQDKFVELLEVIKPSSVRGSAQFTYFNELLTAKSITEINIRLTVSTYSEDIITTLLTRFVKVQIKAEGIEDLDYIRQMTTILRNAHFPSLEKFEFSACLSRILPPLKEFEQKYIYLKWTRIRPTYTAEFQSPNKLRFIITVKSHVWDWKYYILFTLKR